MGIVYHGSKERGIKRLDPKKSTHGTYVYATPIKVLALNFSGRCGDDLTYDIGHFDTDKNGPWELVENIPGAFDIMFSNESSIYSFSDETFKDIHTGFAEVVSDVGVDVLNEEYYENVYESLLQAEREGLIKIYRYPNKPKSLSDDSIINKWRHYKKDLNKEFSKNEFDRLFCLHPQLIDKINALAYEFNYDYHYEPKDLVDIFARRIIKQLYKKDDKDEQYIDSSYISICKTFPEIKVQIDALYDKYLTSLGNKIDNTSKIMN